MSKKKDKTQEQNPAEEAVTRYRETLQMNAFHPWADFHLGRTLLKLGRPAEALPHLGRAVWLHQRDAGVRLKLGEAYLLSGDRPQALEVFRQTLQIDPNNAQARWYLASNPP